MPDAIIAEEFSRAEELLTALQRSGDRWEPCDQRWVFRGHADQSWKLVPPILRGKPEPWLRFLNGAQLNAANIPEARDFIRSVAEFKAVDAFMRTADRAGLAVPEDSQAIRALAAMSRAIVPPPEMTKRHGLGILVWPSTELLSIVALAQHYGIPTRLLDWSWKPRVAAYFAAREVVFPRTPFVSDRLEVWCLLEPAVGWTSRYDDPETLAVVTAPQATNPNLAAQAGLFTLVRDKHEDVALNEVLTERHEKGLFPDSANDRFPIMRRLSLPHSEARRLLRLLGLEFVNAATVFPGYAGVVTSLEEVRHWQK